MSYLLVPVHMDALYVNSEHRGVKPIADYTYLPYGNKNQGKPFVSDTILRTGEIFLESSVYKLGVHLHWALPDTLIRGTHDGKKVEFPLVPQRWLITRRVGDNVEKRWLLESDYLHHPVDSELQDHPVAHIPYKLEEEYVAGNGKSQPFRYLGKAWLLSDWQSQRQQSSDDAALEALTTLGPFQQLANLDHVKATFAGLYSHSCSVFGFLDEDYSNSLPEGLEYEVVGWYAKSEEDILKRWKDEKKSGLSNEKLAEALRQEYQWVVEPSTGDFPDKSLYYAKLSFAKNLNLQSPEEALKAKGLPQITLGNTGTEALSAHLAQQIDPTNRKLIEEQLEALHLETALENHTLDIDSKFRTARHDKEFQGIHGGTLWSIRGIDNPAFAANAKDIKQAGKAKLAQHITQALDELNLKQQAYERTQYEVQSLQEQTFADWCKYLNALTDYDEWKKNNEENYYTYSDAHWPDPGDIREQIIGESDNDDEGFDVPPLHDRKYGKRKLDEDGKETKDWAVVGLKQLQENITRTSTDLRSALEHHNKTNNTNYTLAAAPTEPAPLYWQPKDPVVLLTGDAVNPTVRFGQDGRLRTDNCLDCGVLSGDLNLNKLPDNTLERIAAAISGIDPEKSVGISIWQHQPWHPFLLAWEVEFFPTQYSNLEDEQLRKKIAGYYLNQLLMPTYYAYNEYDDDNNKIEPSEHYLNEHLNDVTAWYQENSVLQNDNEYYSQPIFNQDTRLVLKYYRGESLDSKTELSNLIGILSDYYSTQVITDNYQLSYGPLEKAFDLHPRDKGAFVKTVTSYRGHSLLTPHAKIQHKKILAHYLNAQLNLGEKDPEKCLLDKNDKNYIDNVLENHKKIHFSNTTSDEDKANDPIYTALRAFQILAKTNCLSQALGGFNDALLNLRRVTQLPIYDSRIDDNDEDKAFLKAVKVAVGDVLSRSPINKDFNPIRAGAIKLTKLRLIDTFGQKIDFDCSPLTAETLKSPDSNHTASLPPRIAQPARLNICWLSAEVVSIKQEEESIQTEVNKHKRSVQTATSPICGWILPNHFDNTLVVYDADGKGLGILKVSNQEKIWHSIPGQPAVSVDNIKNCHLRKIVKTLSNRGSEFLTSFQATLDSALINIEPESFAAHNGLSLLIGRPLAVVRASLSLEVKGLPAIAQNSKSLWRDLQVATPEGRATNGFTQVKFPIRLGEHRRLNDGLVGYWLEDNQEHIEPDSPFYSPQSNHIESGQIHTYEDGTVQVEVAIADNPVTMTMLIDPRCQVHATSGILPVRSIAVPPIHYADVLPALEVTFSMPTLLTRSDQIELSLPQETGYTWSWLERTNDTTWSQGKELKPFETKVTFSDQQTVRGGWLVLKQVQEVTTNS